MFFIFYKLKIPVFMSTTGISGILAYAAKKTFPNCESDFLPFQSTFVSDLIRLYLYRSPCIGSRNQVFWGICRHRTRHHIGLDHLWVNRRERVGIDVHNKFFNFLFRFISGTPIVFYIKQCFSIFFNHYIRISEMNL